MTDLLDDFMVVAGVKQLEEGSRYTYSTEHGHTVYYQDQDVQRFELCQLTPIGWAIESMIRDRKGRWRNCASVFLPEAPTLLVREKERMPK